MWEQCSGGPGGHCKCSQVHQVWHARIYGHLWKIACITPVFLWFCALLCCLEQLNHMQIASPVNCIKCTVSEHIAHTVYRVIVPPQKELFILEKLHFTSSIAQFCNFVIFGYKQKLEFFPYNECFRKGPQLRTKLLKWSSLVLILHKSPYFPLKRQFDNSCSMGWLISDTLESNTINACTIK